MAVNRKIFWDVVPYIFDHASEEHDASIFRMEEKVGSRAVSEPMELRRTAKEYK
jgi:hypothetical protein